MFSYLIYLLFAAFWLSLEVLWICRDIAIIGIPWVTLLLFTLWIFAKLFKIPPPISESVNKVLGPEPSKKTISWMVAKGAAGLDAPENTLTAIEKCLMQGINSIHLDVCVSSDGVPLLLNESTVHNVRAADYTFDKLRQLNVTTNHPLSFKYTMERIPTLNEALHVLFANKQRPRLMLKLVNGGPKTLNPIMEVLAKYDQVKEQIILVSTSPLVIYQVRRLCPSQICALWLEAYPSSWGFLGPLYYFILHSMIAPLIGISAIIIHKDIMSVSEVKRWQRINIRPYGYPVNTPSAKRYFQTVLMAQYLTDSLRTEPPAMRLLFKRCFPCSHPCHSYIVVSNRWRYGTMRYCTSVCKKQTIIVGYCPN